MWITRREEARDDWILRILTNRMRQFGKMYPNAGYGGMFRQWLYNPECKALQQLKNRINKKRKRLCFTNRRH